MRFRIVKVTASRGVAAVVAWLGIASASPAVCGAASEAPPPFWAVAELTGEALGCLRGVSAERVAVMACDADCHPIPWQLDERDADGVLALTEGPEPNPDDPPGVVDDNDELHWMVEDAGRRMRPEEAPVAVGCVLEIRVSQPRRFERWGYVVVGPSPAPRSDRRYVRYDPPTDVISGARVALGFGGHTPQYLAVRQADGAGEVNVLDRLKVRVTARFLGVVPVSRDESDLTTQFVAWQAGPIRVVRRQRQWVRVGFGIRSPTFGSDTYFYRDFAELPVSLHLNFPPTYFFSAIVVRAILDFRDLRGWEVVAAGVDPPLTVPAARTGGRERFARSTGEWFALVGPDVTLVQVLGASPSLATVRRRLLYRELIAPSRPEMVAGEMPGVGYELSEWGRVGSGYHRFSSTSYALPPGYDSRRFARELVEPVRIEATEMRAATSR